MHSLPRTKAYTVEERWSRYMQYATLYIEDKYVGHLDWVKFGDFVSCFTLNTKNIKLNSPPTTMMEDCFIEMYF